MAEPTGTDVEILARVGRSLLGSIDLDDQLRLALELAVDSLQGGRGSIMLVDHDSATLRISCSAGLPDEARAASTPMGEGIAGWVAEHNEPVVLHGGVDDPRFVGSDPTIGSAISLPLAVGRSVLGVLNVVRRGDDRFTDDDLELARAIADLAALAIEKASLYRALASREERVSALLEAAIGAQEQERRRIAGEIHDGFLQDLTAVFIKFELARLSLSKGKTEDAARIIGEAQGEVAGISTAVRNFIMEVRPPSLDEVGLGATIKEMLERMTDEHGIGHELHDRTEARLPAPVETVLYRTAQEAVRNVVKHSGAGTVRVALWAEDSEAFLEVQDDGKGFDVDGDPARGHFGIETMRERVTLAGGALTLTAGAGGTRVEARVPVG